MILYSIQFKNMMNMNNEENMSGGVIISTRTNQLINILKEFNEINDEYVDWLAEEYEDEEIINEASNKFAEFASSIEKHLKRRLIGILNENNFTKL